MRGTIAAIIVSGLIGLTALSSTGNPQSRTNSRSTPSSHPGSADTDSHEVQSLKELCALDASARSRIDIARANLLTAKAAPGAENIDVDAILQTLDQWAKHVASETDRHMYRWHQNPAEYNHSKGYFRMLMLIVVLQEDYGVRYNPARIHDPDFTNPADLFIHGMIDPAGEGGTCVSMPVLYTAIARRLGYPVNLVTTKAHVFARWDDGLGDRFNIEGTNRGMRTPTDEELVSGNTHAKPEEIEQIGYHAALDAHESHAVFLASLGHVQLDTGDPARAAETYAHAASLDPDNALYPYFIATTSTPEDPPIRVGMGHQRDGYFDIMSRIDRINRENMERLGLPHHNSGGVPGMPTGPTLPPSGFPVQSP